MLPEVELPHVEENRADADPDGEDPGARTGDPWARIAELSVTVRRLEQRLAAAPADLGSQGAEAAERLMRSIFDSLDGRMCIIAADGRILSTNLLWNEIFPEAAVRFDAYRPLSGAPEPGEQVGLGLILEKLPPRLADDLRGAITEVVEGDSAHGEARGSWYGPIGREEAIFRVHKVRDHAYARAVIVMVDVTESLRTRERLRRVTEQAHLLAMVAQHMDNSVFILDPAGAIEWVNDAFTRTTGYRRADLVGQDQQQLVGTLIGDPDLTEFNARLQAGETADLEGQARRKDGTPYWMELRMQPLRERDRPDRMIGVLRDVNERHLAAQRITASQQQAEALAGELSMEKALLAKVLNSIPHLVYWKDADLRYAGVNDAFLLVRACGTAEQVLGRPEGELPCRDSLKELLPPLEERVLADGVAVENVRINLPTGSGPPRQLFLSVLPQSDEDGRVTGVIGVAADVTQLSLLESQLAQATRLESIGQLAAGVAHEINTPVQFVSDNVRFVSECFEQVAPALQQLAGLAAGAADDAAPPVAGLEGVDLEFIVDEVPSALSQSLEGLSRVAQIVRAMKDFSHPGSERSSTDLNRAIESTIQVSRNEWKYVANCDVQLDPEVGIVPCFEGEIKQAVLNLIVNAAQAVGEDRQRRGLTGPGHLEVRSRRERDQVMIEVADDGPGMTEEVRARIFDPFFTTKDVGKGTGQGLSMVHATVVQKHEGRIEVETSPGHGARFVITLPAPRPGPAR